MTLMVSDGLKRLNPEEEIAKMSVHLVLNIETKNWNQKSVQIGFFCACRKRISGKYLYVQPKTKIIVSAFQSLQQLNPGVHACIICVCERINVSFWEFVSVYAQG